MWTWTGFAAVRVFHGENTDGTDISGDQSSLMGVLVALCMTSFIAIALTTWVVQQVRGKRRRG